MILHLSDPHFGRHRPDAVAALLMLARAQRPSVVVLSGDITQRARPREFRAARTFIDDLCAVAGLDLQRDVLVQPGNHDLPLFNLLARLTRPYGNYRAAFGDELEPVIERPGVLIVGVNTTRPWRHKHGTVSRAQIARTSERLRAAPSGTLRIVVTHQPVLVIDDDDRKDLLRGHERALRAWSAAGADLILGGHIHQSFVVPARLQQTDLAHDTWVVQTGTAVSTRIRQRVPNSVHLIDFNAAAPLRAVVQRWDLEPAGTAFRQVTSTEVRASDSGRAPSAVDD